MPSSEWFYRREVQKKKLNLYLHEEDVVPLGRGQDLLHLLGVHGQRLLAQHVLLGVRKEQTSSQMVGVDNANIHHICTRTDTQTRQHSAKREITLSVKIHGTVVYQQGRKTLVGQTELEISGDSTDGWSLLHRKSLSSDWSVLEQQIPYIWWIQTTNAETRSWQSTHLCLDLWPAPHSCRMLGRCCAFWQTPVRRLTCELPQPQPVKTKHCLLQRLQHSSCSTLMKVTI